MSSDFRVGDKVWLERWELNKGFFLSNYQVVAVERGSVGLREIGVLFPDGTTLPGNDSSITLKEAQLSIPLDQRLAKLKKDVEAMMSHFDS